MADPYVIVVETQASTPLIIDVINTLTVYGQGGVTSVNGQTGNITITANSIGLGLVDNTPDLAKPVSNATATALAGKAALVHTHVIGEVTGLQTALDGKQASGNYVLGNDTRLSDARTPLAHTHAIADVTGLQTALDGKLSITSANATFQPISGMTVYLTANLAATTYQTIANNTFANLSGAPNISLYAPLANPNFTGNATAPTAANGTNSTQLATTAFVANALSGYVTLTGTQTLTNKTISNATISGTQTFNNQIIKGPQIQSAGETTASPAISSGTLTLDLSTANVFKVSLNAAITTISITNCPSGVAFAFVLEFTYTGTAYSVVWSPIVFPGGTTPTLTNTSGKRDTFVVLTTNGGTSWTAFISGQNA